MLMVLTLSELHLEVSYIATGTGGYVQIKWKMNATKLWMQMSCSQSNNWKWSGSGLNK